MNFTQSRCRAPTLVLDSALGLLGELLTNSETKSHTDRMSKWLSNILPLFGR